MAAAAGGGGIPRQDRCQRRPAKELRHGGGAVIVGAALGRVVHGYGHRGSVGSLPVRHGVRACAVVLQECLRPSQHCPRQLGQAFDGNLDPWQL